MCVRLRDLPAETLRQTRSTHNTAHNLLENANFDTHGTPCVCVCGGGVVVVVGVGAVSPFESNATLRAQTLRTECSLAFRTFYGKAR